MKRTEIDQKGDDTAPRNVIMYSFLGVILLILPFAFLVTQQEDEKGKEYNTITSTTHNTAPGFRIVVDKNNQLYIWDRPVKRESVIYELEEMLKRYELELPLSISIMGKEKSKVGEVLELGGFLESRYSDKISITYI